MFSPSQHRPNFSCSDPKHSSQIRYLGSSHCAINMYPSYRLLVPHEKRQQSTKIRYVSNFGQQFFSHCFLYHIHQSVLRLGRDRQRPTRIPSGDLAKWKAHITMCWLVTLKKVVNSTPISLNTFHAKQLRSLIPHTKISSKKFLWSSIGRKVQVVFDFGRTPTGLVNKSPATHVSKFFEAQRNCLFSQHLRFPLWAIISRTELR